MTIEAKPTRYQVGKYVVDNRDPNKDIWAVTDDGCCLNTSNEWEYEPLPSNRSDAFKSRTRYTLEDAIRRAKEVQDEGHS